MSRTSLWKKLRILSGSRVLIFNASDGYQKIDDLPDNVSVSRAANGEFDVVLSFFTRKADIDSQVELLKSAMGQKGILWVSYPKVSSGKATDLNRDILRAHLADRGLEGVSLIALDDIWSSMRFKKKG